MTKNDYDTFASEICEVIRHTRTEYTFRMAYSGPVKPGQFFEVSLPKFGEAPISVSGISNGLIDLTIRRVGRVTNEIFEQYQGRNLFLRGPYGNGFELSDFDGKELVVVAGGTGVSPVRGVVEAFTAHPERIKRLIFIAGFKTPDDILFRNDFSRWTTTAHIILTVDHANGSTVYPEGLVTQYIPALHLQDVSTAAAIVVGPPAMMKFSTQGLLSVGFRTENIWVSYERKMCCGLGKCGHCRMNDTYICMDGPVFRLSQAQALVD